MLYEVITNALGQGAGQLGRGHGGGDPAAVPEGGAVEAATENTEIKLKLFRAADEALRPGAILASNTSSISITKLAANTRPPRRSG